MIICDLYQLSAELKGESGRRKISYSLYSDLPAGTRAIISLERFYYNSRGEKCVWTGVGPGFGDEAFFKPNIYGDFAGLEDEIDVELFDRCALEEFEAIITSLSLGVVCRVSDELQLIISVGARQRIRAFGKNNENLTGGMVAKKGSVNIVEAEISFNAPVLAESQPFTSND